MVPILKGLTAPILEWLRGFVEGAVETLSLAARQIVVAAVVESIELRQKR
jgi:hypothetical protein